MMHVDQMNRHSSKWISVGTRATARVSALLHIHPRPYNDYENEAFPRVVIVRAGEEWMRGGDPCGRPRALSYFPGMKAEIARSAREGSGRPRALSYFPGMRGS
jgi:hypothetical protein